MALPSMIFPLLCYLFQELPEIAEYTHTHTHTHIYVSGFPGVTGGEEPSCQCRTCKRWRFNPWVRKIPWRRAWQLTAVFLPGESHGQRSLGIRPIELKRVGHDWSDSAHMHKCIISLKSVLANQPCSLNRRCCHLSLGAEVET